MPAKGILASRKMASEWMEKGKLAMGKNRQVEVAPTYKVVVDYVQSLAEMINLGKYDWSNEAITANNFPLQGTGKQEVELVLVHLNQAATTREVQEYLKDHGLESAKIEHLLAFGAAYPELQRQFPIIALGSSFVRDSGHRYYPYLDCYAARRKLYLLWNVGNPWHDVCRFLAFRK